MKRSLIFCGVKHSGKSLYGRLSADKLGARFIDTDDLLLDLFEEMSPSAVDSVRGLYNKLGEEEFRRFEGEAVNRLAERIAVENCVVSLGGGVSDNKFVAMDKLKASAFFIMLDVPEKIAFERIRRRGYPSFLLEEGHTPEELFHQLYERRRDDCLKLADWVYMPEPNKEPVDNSEKLIFELKRMGVI